MMGAQRLVVTGFHYSDASDYKVIWFMFRLNNNIRRVIKQLSEYVSERAFPCRLVARAGKVFPMTYYAH